jgi:hypothetical protein
VFESGNSCSTGAQGRCRQQWKGSAGEGHWKLISGPWECLPLQCGVPSWSRPLLPLASFIHKHKDYLAKDDPWTVVTVAYSLTWSGLPSCSVSLCVKLKLMVSWRECVMLLSAVRLTLVKLLYVFISDVRHLVEFMWILSASYCEIKFSVFSRTVPVEGYLPFFGRGVQLIFHPNFVSELRLHSASPQHPLIVKGKGKGEVVLVYTMKFYRSRSSCSLAVQPNSDLGRPIGEVSRSPTLRHTHTHTLTHASTHTHAPPPPHTHT